MQTRQELILDFMKAMMATDETCKVASDCFGPQQQDYVRDIYLMAAKFADYMLERM